MFVLQLLSLTFVFTLADARLVKRDNKFPTNTLQVRNGQGVCVNTPTNTIVADINTCVASVTEKNYYMNIDVYLQGASGTWYYAVGASQRVIPQQDPDPASFPPPVYYLLDFPASTCTLIINAVPYNDRRLAECNFPNSIESRFYFETVTTAAGIKERRCVEFYKYVPWNTPRYVPDYPTKELCESAIAGNAIPLVEEPRSVKIASAMLKSVTIDPMAHFGKNAVVSPLALELAAAVCVEGATEGHATQTELLKGVFQLEGPTALADFQTYAAPLENIHRSLKVVAAAAGSTEKLGFGNFFALDTTQLPDVDGDYFRIYQARTKGDLGAVANDVATAINDNWRNPKKGAVAAAKTLLTDGQDFGAAPKVVLVNSLYAKLDWAEAFSPANDAEFYTTAQRDPLAGITNQRMMAKAFQSLPYGETSDMEWIRVPFKDADYNMYFVLPKSAKTVADLKAPGSGFGFIMENPQLTSDRAVDVTLPRFNIEFVKGDFEDVLRVDSPTAFAVGADFTPMLGAQGTPITKVRHVVNLQVYEAGINGVAVPNPVAGAALAATPTSKQFVANHPFLFFVTGTKNDRTYVLFAGQFYNQV